MRNREFKAYLQGALRQGEAGRIEKKAEIVAGCKAVMREQAQVLAEKRTGFWQFLSDVFRFEGQSIFGLQAAVLVVTCLWLGAVEDVAYFLSAFTPLFALAAMPALLRSQYYKTEELEAVTRASGAEIILAKLLLAGAANLVCITLLLCLFVYLRRPGEGIGQMILYGLVPYLVCMTVILRLVRLHRRDRISVCAVAIAGSGVGWGILAKVMPQAYEMSTTGLWIVLFVVFAIFYGREISFILERKREGKQYGINN